MSLLGPRETAPVRGAAVAGQAWLEQQARLEAGVVAYYALCPCGCGEDLRWLARCRPELALEVPECRAAQIVHHPGAGV